MKNSSNLEIIEINASDTRNKDSINSLIGASIGQQSLFFKGKLILIDEIDGLSGTKDRGGAQALLKIIENSPYPVIMTCNEIESDKLKAIKKKSELVEFPPLDHTHIFVGSNS